MDSRLQSRRRSWMLDRSRPSARELLLAAALLACLGGAVYGSHIVDGDLYVDDRWFYSFYEYAPGYFSGVEAIMESGEFGFRPLQAAQMGAAYELFGLDPEPHLAWALALAVLAAASFYALLRTLGIERLHAGAIAFLALLSPAADSTKLWSAAGHNNMALVLYFAGATLALRGFDAVGRRAALTNAAALLLFVLSVLLYEAAAVAMLLSVLLYRLRVPWRRAARRWALDVVVVGAVLAVDALATDRSAQSLSEQLSTLERFARDAVSLVLAGGIPYGSRDLFLPVFVLAFLAIVSAFVWPEWRSWPAVRAQVERWALVAAAAAVGIAAAYVILIPAGYLRPLDVGMQNRTNLLAAFGIVTLLYALLMLTGTLAFRFWARWREASVAFALVLWVVLAVAYVDRVREDKAQWAEAAAVHRAELASLDSALPEPPPDSTVYSVGNQQEVAPGLPGLIWWDLYGAGRVMWGPSVKAVLIAPGTDLVCEDGFVRPSLGYGLADRAYETGGAYRRAYVVELPAGRIERIDDRAECRAATRSLDLAS
jgi:hypothetical protein